MSNNRKPLMAALMVLSLLLASCASMRTSGYSERDSVVRFAKNMLDKKYQLGQGDPGSGFDCSGLTKYAYKEAGIIIPRTSKEQYEKCRKVGRDQLLPGDLVFFSTYAPGPTHVGIYMGKNRFIHSPSDGKRVQIVDMENPYWKSHFFGAGTYF